MKCFKTYANTKHNISYRNKDRSYRVNAVTPCLAIVYPLFSNFPNVIRKPAPDPVLITRPPHPPYTTRKENY